MTDNIPTIATTIISSINVKPFCVMMLSQKSTGTLDLSILNANGFYLLFYRGTYTSLYVKKPSANMSREQRIYDALFVELKPEVMNIKNESHGHNVPAGSETHFKVVAVSKQFENLLPVARHRIVNQLLADEFSSGLHALSLHLYTPDEWRKRTPDVPASPPCHNHKRKKE